jgi:hypothetical protein
VGYKRKRAEDIPRKHEGSVVLDLVGGFSALLAENFSSIVLFPTNSTYTSAIYKLIGGLAGWLVQHCTFFCP